MHSGRLCPMQCAQTNYGLLELACKQLGYACTLCIYSAGVDDDLPTQSTYRSAYLRWQFVHLPKTDWEWSCGSHVV